MSDLLHLACEVVREPSKVVVFKPTAGFRPFKQFFVHESVKHPAKANLHMLRWIIEKWTEKGDVILDPMAGTYSTCVMASMLERNSIGVEYEEKFYQMGLKNKEVFEQTYMMPKGKIVVLKGDARSLSDVLLNNSKEIDAIISSPPYSNIAHKTLKNPVDRRDKDPTLCHEYSDDKSNIGNLPHGNIDAIVTSPPYEATVSKQGGRQAGHPSKKDIELGMDKTELPYSNDSKNLGNLKGETYLSAMLKVYAECYKVLKPNGLMILITKNFIRKKKVVRLDHDTIKLCQKVGFLLIDRWYRKLTHFSFWIINYYKKYGLRVEYEDILVFLKPNGTGKIDSVIMSPPYGIKETSQETSKREIERRIKRGIHGAVRTANGKYMTGSGKRKQIYSKDETNIGNLPYGSTEDF